ncbi:hypothetical protein [Burkholderia stagnalis]|uniref:hypothetical protein n=1 Tax=Burkholderia stagnalis TaxID=1503054 RepID=UPI001E5AD198|nr:hypothetical protein [Burkholderia stagnalis]
MEHVMNPTQIAGKLIHSDHPNKWQVIGESLSASEMLAAVEYVWQHHGSAVIFAGAYFYVEPLMRIKRTIDDLIAKARGLSTDQHGMDVCNRIGYSLGNLQAGMWFTGEPNDLWSLFDLASALKWHDGIEHLVAGYATSVHARTNAEHDHGRLLAREALVMRLESYMRANRAYLRVADANHISRRTLILAACNAWGEVRSALAEVNGEVSVRVEQCAEDACALANRVGAMPGTTHDMPEQFDGQPVLMQAWSDGAAGLPPDTITRDMLRHEFDRIRAELTPQDA